MTLKVNDPIRIIGGAFETSLGTVKEGSIGRVLELLYDKPERIKVEIYGPVVTLYVQPQFLEYHQPPDDEYR